MTDIIIAEAVRSAVGRAIKGSLAQKRPDELAGDVIRGLLARVPQVKAADVEDVILGCAMPEGEQGLNVARVAAMLGGLPEETAAITINRFCSSGLQAIALAAARAVRPVPALSCSTRSGSEHCRARRRAAARCLRSACAPTRGW